MKTALLILALVIAASAQTDSGGVQRFSKDGLSFDYPAGWTLTDSSNAQLQHLILRRPDTSSLVMVVAQREPLQNVGQLYASRNSVTRPYVENIARQLGAKVPDAPDTDCLTVGESLAPGFRLAGRIGDEPGTGEVYVVVKGQRLVHLIHIRRDVDEAAGTPAWKKLVETLNVEPPANPSPDAAKMGTLVSGGVLNGQAMAKPQPYYPPAAKSARASGTVVVQITVDERGKVIEAQAVSGHPQLRGAGEDAARRATFSPTLLCGKPVKVSGVITYNFVLR